MKKVSTKLLSLALMLLTVMTSFAQKERSEIEDKYKWNFTDLYESDQAWSAAKDKLAQEMEKVSSYKGQLGTSAASLLNYMQYSEQLMKEGYRLYIYASLKSDVDLRDADNMGRVKEIRQVFIEYGQKASFVTPELAAIPEATMKQFIAEEPKLKIYEMGLMDVYRMKMHTLSELEEAVMAKTGMITGTANAAFSVFSNAEMPRATIMMDGKETELTPASFSVARSSADREMRQEATKVYWDNYLKYEGTFGEMLNGQVKVNVFRAKARNYNSALEAAVKPNNIPVEVYKSLVENVNNNLETFHRYLALKKRMLGVDELVYSDMYAPTVKGVELKYSYEEAQELILTSLKPLGKEYVEVVDKAFNSRWIDVYPNPGKRSGAYSNGGAYDVHPYILMNYTDQYNEVSTLTHELGHTMHSYFSNKTQPFATADYATFVAEVASTFNEVLLNDMMQKKLKDDDLRLSLLMSMLDGFKGTLFRQTQFAEFELAIHEAAEKGTPLTGKVLTQMYGDITRKYYGHDKGVCTVEDNIAVEWAAIPHFYMNFYVYQYSTSFVASQALAAKVLEGDKEATKRYIEFLSSGGSDYPIELLKKAGVDMTSSEPFDKAIEAMNSIMDEIEAILNKKK
ncbi:oligoendopeptidase F [Carboxylicivirga sediminis]|uniref:Oligopeptidase F n=1 Tax=Carboxylicivirga sediminis TaxID=2006564 RepID=A0A941F1S6_9BACT|nr:oligoendopeptidase F [Carboxylicivirga sediminis]MBR8535166.1 oligoendopeptidase F [Carboxylicivirga sediminis]